MSFCTIFTALLLQSTVQRQLQEMARISVENALVEGHHVYFSYVNVRDIYDCFPEFNNVCDPHAISVNSNRIISPK